MKRTQNWNVLRLLAITTVSAAALGIAGCFGGSSSSGGNGGSDNGDGGTAGFLTAAEIYDGDYDGPDGLTELDTPEAAAQAMDLAYLASRVEDVLFTLELLIMEVEDEDTPITIPGTRPDVADPGQMTFTRESNGTDLTETWTMEGPDGFCVDKASTSGPVCIKGSMKREETVEFSGNEPSSITAETTFEELKASFRGGMVEMTGTELAQSAGSDENATALAVDIAFVSNSEKDIDTEIRLWRDGLAEGIDIENPEDFSRTVTMTIATPLVDGRIETTQFDTFGNIETFGGHSCQQGLFGPDYEDATSGRVEITHDGGELIAELGLVGDCGEFTVSGGPEGNFPLLGTLFSGPQAAAASTD